MDLTTKQWIITLIVVLIVIIVIDGLRRMREAKRNSIKMSLKVDGQESPKENMSSYGSEFPNGGARPSEKEIDKDHQYLKIERLTQLKSIF